jgi:hypothetical protein
MRLRIGLVACACAALALTAEASASAGVKHAARGQGAGPKKIDQVITVTSHAPANAVYDTTFSVAATGGGSGNPVTFSRSGACSNKGSSFTMTSGSGVCTVTYDQAGNANYNPAHQVAEKVHAQKVAQVITVTTHAPATAVYGTGFTVAATGGASGAPVVFSSGGACSNVGASFTMISGTGRVL